ncbi:venom protease-like [Monomorium pharaonis]|uniref:venom protease-like n=1 Tax=Monomorium pharaonis TaxID=307658 RepID=UPI0017465969|nr:venom protease-like [Monomorium pharaonis]
MCSGSILTTLHIITDFIFIAAHCLSRFSFDVKEHSINLFAIFDPNISAKEESLTKRRIAYYKIHPDYVKMSIDSNLAIAFLNRPIEYSPFIKPICLWSDSMNYQNINNVGYTVGWRSICCRSNYTDIKYPLMARMPILNQEICVWNNEIYSRHISNYTLCIGGNKGTLCNVPGDTGGGLVIFDEITGRYYLRGIFLESVCQVGFDLTKEYYIYVDISKNIPWIQQQIT